MCNLRYAQLQNHKRQHHDAQSPVVVIIDDGSHHKRKEESTKRLEEGGNKYVTMVPYAAASSKTARRRTLLQSALRNPPCLALVLVVGLCFDFGRLRIYGINTEAGALVWLLAEAENKETAQY